MRDRPSFLFFMTDPGAISRWSRIPEDYLKIYPEARSIGPAAARSAT